MDRVWWSEGKGYSKCETFSERFIIHCITRDKLYRSVQALLSKIYHINNPHKINNDLDDAPLLYDELLCFFGIILFMSTISALVSMKTGAPYRFHEWMSLHRSEAIINDLGSTHKLNLPNRKLHFGRFGRWWSSGMRIWVRYFLPHVQFV